MASSSAARHLRNRISSLLARSSSLFVHEVGGGSVSSDVSPLWRSSSQMISGLRSWSSSSASHLLERRVEYSLVRWLSLSLSLSHLVVKLLHVATLKLS